MSRPSPLFQLYLTRLREFYRQPARIFWVYGFPTVVAVVLGLAFQSRPPESIQVDLVENAATAPIRQILDAYNASAIREKKPRLLLEVVPPVKATDRLRTGDTPLVIEPRISGPIFYRYDPTRPEALTARAAIDDILQRARGRVDPVATQDELVREPGSRYIDFLIPGLIGVNAMGGGLWGIGFLVVNFRIAKLLKCFVATPMPRRDFLLALLASRLTFLLPDLIVLLSLGAFVFGMPIRGSLILVVVIDVIGALAFAGIGLLVGSRAQTTETVSGLMNLVMIPMWLFSGVFFSSARFPNAVQPFIQALPLTQLIWALRRVILHGDGWLVVAPAMLILAVWAVVTFVLALRIFRWT
jgi:ABC-2 type transport system permease protein